MNINLSVSIGQYWNNWSWTFGSHDDDGAPDDEVQGADTSGGDAI